MNLSTKKIGLWIEIEIIRQDRDTRIKIEITSIIKTDQETITKIQTNIPTEIVIIEGIKIIEGMTIGGMMIIEGTTITEEINRAQVIIGRFKS